MNLWELIATVPTPSPTPPGTEGSGSRFDISLLVSTLAFAVSGATLAWTLYRHYLWNRPRLVVSGRWVLSQEGTSSSPRLRRFWDLDVVVVNIGDVETTIENVYWEFEDAHGHPFGVQGSTDVGERGISDELRFTTFTGAALSPSVPLVIPRYTSQRWLFRRDTERAFEAIDNAARGRPVVQWVSRKAIESPYGDHPHIVAAHGPWQTFDAGDPESIFLDGHDKAE
ncbi:MAG: hypothetical protein ACOH1J_09295 [Microbacteriaceae bacterium]